MPSLAVFELYAGALCSISHLQSLHRCLPEKTKEVISADYDLRSTQRLQLVTTNLNTTNTPPSEQFMGVG